ncbi:MAG: hypothetical protein ACI9UT_002061 [Flavobacteriales bacterium]|jgi:hypothetical protein
MYPFKLHSNDFHVICPKNKPFYTEILEAGKAVAEPPKLISTKSILVISAAMNLQVQVSQHKLAYPLHMQISPDDYSLSGLNGQRRLRWKLVAFWPLK